VLGIILTIILRLTNRTVAGQATTLVAVLFLGGIQSDLPRRDRRVPGTHLRRGEGPLYLIREAWGFEEERRGASGWRLKPPALYPRSSSTILATRSARAML